MKPRAIAVGLMGLASLVPLGAAAQGVRLPGAQRPQLSAPVAAPSNTQRQADFIVAVVNAEPVTNNEVRARMARVLRQIQQSGGAQPPLDLLAAEVMEQLIVEKAQMQLAKESGITVDELAIDQAAQTIARRNEVSMEEMLRRLSAEGVSREQFRLELRRQLTLQRLREREVDARVRVSEPEIDQFLREQSPQGADLAR
ncbi:MAG TPA: SurA N-terminal domain-containing protein, partial [Giesbergeria sp.]|nr:SurA N-terminal domain-containing protein [Giesbergeria sp.]